MNSDVIITCAITGDDTKVTKSPHCPITPEQIAASAVEAARAGAAIVHIHVRDPETGAFSMATRHYREVVRRVRESKVDVLINLTCGMGGYICIGKEGLKDTPAPGTDFVTQRERMRHVIEMCEEGLYRPEIATLDCGTLNFGDGNRAYISTPDYCREGAGILRELGVKVELEVFQLCTGIPYGVPADVGHLLAMVNYLPADCIWTSFAVSRMQMPWVAQSILLGGNVRVGLEDNLYLSKGVYASNAQLVEKARTIIEAMGARVLTAAQTRERLKLS